MGSARWSYIPTFRNDPNVRRDRDGSRDFHKSSMFRFGIYLRDGANCEGLKHFLQMMSCTLVFVPSFKLLLDLNEALFSP